MNNTKHDVIMCSYVFKMCVYSVGREAANILNKQSRAADKGWPPAWGLGEVLTTPHRKK
jgi:hypothetical protein